MKPAINKITDLHEILDKRLGIKTSEWPCFSAIIDDFILRIPYRSFVKIISAIPDSATRRDTFIGMVEGIASYYKWILSKSNGYHRGTIVDVNTYLVISINKALRRNVISPTDTILGLTILEAAEINLVAAAVNNYYSVRPSDKSRFRPKTNLRYLLEQAILIATEAHSGQTDRGGRPYILHPLHVMSKVLPDLKLAIVAVLHDVIEDTDITINDLRAKGYPEDVLDALIAISRKRDEQFLSYMRRVANNYMASKVKLYDAEHNSDVGRLRDPKQKDYDRAEFYYRIKIFLDKTVHVMEHPPHGGIACTSKGQNNE